MMQTDLIGARVEIGGWVEEQEGLFVWHRAGSGVVRAVGEANQAWTFIVQWEGGKLSFEAPYTLRVVDKDPIPPTLFLGREHRHDTEYRA